MADDPHSTIVSILQTNWNSSNTSSVTPEIGIITDYKRIDANVNPVWILVHRNKPEAKPQGIGVYGKQINNKMDVDIRVFGSQGTKTTDISLYNEILTEVDRIFDSKITNPGGGFSILDPDGRGPDLSNKTHFIYRQIITVDLIVYNQQRAAQA